MKAIIPGDRPELPRVLSIALQRPIRRRGEDEVNGLTRNPVQVSGIATMQGVYGGQDLGFP